MNHLFDCQHLAPPSSFHTSSWYSKSKQPSPAARGRHAAKQVKPNQPSSLSSTNKFSILHSCCNSRSLVCDPNMAFEEIRDRGDTCRLQNQHKVKPETCAVLGDWLQVRRLLLVLGLQTLLLTSAIGKPPPQLQQSAVAPLDCPCRLNNQPGGVLGSV